MILIYGCDQVYARAQTGSCLRIKLNKASESKGKKTAPSYVFVMGLRAPYICIMSQMVLSHGTCDKRPKGAVNNTCVQGAAWPLVAEDSLIFNELGLSGPESVG